VGQEHFSVGRKILIDGGKVAIFFTKNVNLSNCASDGRVGVFND
jgi:hypothetical protein